MRWTQFFIPDTKETPHDAVAPSYRPGIRPWLNRQVAAGGYTYLPLGPRTLLKNEGIHSGIRNEFGVERMDGTYP